MMAAVAGPPHASVCSIPQLRFGIEGSGTVDYAAVPTLKFSLLIGSDAGAAIRSILLDVQIQIAARQRGYDDGARQQLLELFGEPERWRTTLRTLPWTRTTAVVPPFVGSVAHEIPVPCTYDLELTASRYFAALHDGEVPLEFLFSGSVFYANEQGLLQTARIALDQTVEYRMPVSVWRDTMARHFPRSAWLRLGTDSFERLSAYKARHALESWDAVFTRLLDGEEAA